MITRALLARSIALLAAAALPFLLTASCGSGIAASSGDGGDEGGFAEGGGDGAARDGDSSFTPLADGPFSCGKSLTCRADQFCLQPCCGGAAPLCEPKPDSGVCPAGFHPASCPQTATEGCQQDPCTPAPPSCIDDPSKGGFGCGQEGSSRYLVCECA